MPTPPPEHRPTFGWLMPRPDPDRPLDARYVQAKWVRLYRIGPWRTATVIALALVLVITSMAVTLAITAAVGVLGRVVVLAVGLTVLAAAFGSVARLMTTGVYVTDDAVRVVGLRRLSVIGWDDVVDVRRWRTATRPLGILPAREAEVVVLVRRGGDDIATPLTSVSADFLGRPEAFDIAALALDRWWQDSRR